ncbi:rCG41123 [Rattus norvegicus]|uniref:RCG41123 n=1 Tax=Rattus norvegicus TaxID=10116 RepID=A6KIJ7_RAT|nr:rCG41123 [Rattus norvegicus]
MNVIPMPSFSILPMVFSFWNSPQRILQCPAAASCEGGFCQGEADDLKRKALYFSLTNSEQSVKNLYP